MSRTDRFVTALGFGFGITLALAAITLACWIGGWIVEQECRFRSRGPMIWMPEN